VYSLLGCFLSDLPEGYMGSAIFAASEFPLKEKLAVTASGRGNREAWYGRWILFRERLGDYKEAMSAIRRGIAPWCCRRT
jgi:hypothetical protein